MNEQKKPRFAWSSPYKYNKVVAQLMPIIREAAKWFPEEFDLQIIPCEELKELRAENAKLKELYMAAVEGRRTFRKLYSELRTKQTIIAAASTAFAKKNDKLTQSRKELREALEIVSSPDMWIEENNGLLDWRGVEDFGDIIGRALAADNERFEDDV